MQYIAIESHDEIDITKHAIIEASAGTGKTYTIENLVVKFLMQRHDLDLENILLVTFTEKATCELRIRIREKLETQLTQISDPVDIQKIKTALDAFESASIYTIHGFCQSVLKDYAFENNTPFQWEVINDAAIFERLLKEQIRKKWPAQFGASLSDILSISDFFRKKEKFESSIIKVARSFQQNTESRIYPDVRQSTPMEITENISMIRKIVWELKNLSTQMPFCHGFEAINGVKPQKKILLDNVVTPLAIFLAEIDSETFFLNPLLDILSFINEKGTEYLRIKYPKKSRPNPDVCPHWDIVSGHLETLHSIYSSIKDVLQSMAVFQLQEDVHAEKLKNGWISFDDMLSHVQNAVCSPDGAALVNILRKKYKVAFVDEFQDTDPVQWKIFLKIFIEEQKNELKNLLFLIGDPKQAIYGFRGADVYAYLEARHELERFAKLGSANCYRLATNWRSESDLISLFNRLFGIPGWFGEAEKCGNYEISYFPVQAPDEKKRIFSIKKDHSKRGFLNIIDLSEASSLKLSKPLLAEFIALEIKYLMSKDSIIFYDRKKEKTDKLSYGDFCVLVRGKSDLPFLEEQFNRHRIPYSYYKKPGLFSSPEAFYLSLVLEAIEDPADMTKFHKALLTPFFNFAPADLYQVEALSPQHRVKQLLFQWHEWAFAGKWTILFQSLMEDSGLIFREAIKSDWERIYTNYCQIIEHLHEKAYHQNLDFRGLTALLDGYRKGTQTIVEDADLHQIETEDQKVRIMTMHVAKGLEFPVVFVFGGLTQPSNSGTDFYVYHKISGKPGKPVKIFDFSKSPEGKEKYHFENESEDKRLYYVALTRARLKLYVPCFEYNKNYQWVGPVSRLLSPALIRAFSREDNPDQNVRWVKWPSSNAPDLFSHEFEKSTIPDIIDHKNNILPVAGPFFPQPLQFTDRVIEMASFSSISHMTQGKKEPHKVSYEFSTIPDKSKDDDEIFASHERIIMEKSGDPNDIPGGTETGSMFHDILEKISFEKVSQALHKIKDDTHPLLSIPETRELIETHMENYLIDRRWTDLVSDVIMNTLATPISYLSESFMLAHLKNCDRLHEAEFYFPYSLKSDESIPDCRVDDGFIRGFIDLIFRHKNKFYIADWKSNIIEDGYDRNAMERTMDRANYHLQYQIYTIAAVRWLKKTLGDGFDPGKNFGGVFYFFIRGMNGKDNNGIYYLTPDRIGTIEMLEKTLFENCNY